MPHSLRAQAPSASRSVLIVEDEPILAKNIMRFLSRRGYQVSTASCALDALRELAARHIDIVVLDIDLPDGNGLDFYKRVFPDYPHLQLIVITGRHSPGDEERANLLGARGFFRKPFTLAALVEAADGLSAETRSVRSNVPMAAGTSTCR